MDKLLTIPQYDNRGEPNTRLLPDLRPEGFRKTAGVLPPEVQEYLAGLNPDPNFLYLLIVALGAADYWGSNVNGDAFFEKALLETQSPQEAMRNPAPYTGQQMPRYKTFVFAKIRKHHQNKDQHPDYGHVELPVYDHAMKRVMLIVAVDRRKAPDIVSEAEAGNPIVWSMGCKVSKDLCSICNKPSKKVSDYCFLGDVPVTMADGTTKPISKVNIGDIVVDANGLPTRVMATFSREIEEEIIEFETSMTGDVIGVTRNHPILFSAFEDNVCHASARANVSTRKPSCHGARPECKGCRKTRSTRGYHPAENLRLGDLVYSPIMQNTNLGTVQIDPEKAWVLGMFLAEGSFGKQKGKISSLQYTLGASEVDYQERLKGFFFRRYGKDAKVYPASSGDSVSLRVHSVEIGAEFFEYFGEYANRKFMRNGLIEKLQSDSLEALYRGLMDGDGCYYENSSAAKTRLNSASKRLVEQSFEVSKILGHVSYMGRGLTVSGGPTQRSNKFDQWYMNTAFGQEDKPVLSPAYWIDGENMVGYVNKLNRRMFSGVVYNLETEDGTYVAGHVAVHNCDHLKYQMNQTLPSGEKVYAVNPTPRFFDISKVLIPADKTAFTLMKVASEKTSAALALPDYYAPVHDCGEMAKVASAQSIVVPSAYAAEHLKMAEKLSSEKQGEITKRVPVVTADGDLSDNAAQAKAVRAAHGISCGEKSLPESVLSGLGGFPLHQILSSMAGLGMVAKPKEFRRIIVIKVNRNAPVADMSPMVMPEAVKTAAVQLLAPFVTERSACSPWIEKRACRAATPEYYFLDGNISEMYTQYRNSLLEWSPEDTERVMSKYASQIESPLGAEDEMFDAMVGMSKTARLGSNAAKASLAAGALFAPYMASAHLRLKSAYQGKPLEGAKKVVAENPGAISVGTLGSSLALAKLLGKI